MTLFRIKPKTSGAWIFPLIAFFFILVFLLQYSCRSLDDNRLTSWEPAFRFADFSQVLAILCLGMVIAWLPSRLLFITRCRSVLLFLLSFGLSIPFWGGPEMIVDSARYFTQAKYLELYGPVFFLEEWGRQIFAWTDTPVVPFIYGTIFRYFGESRLYIQIFTTSCFAMTVVLTYLLGRRLWDEETGFNGALLLTGIPFLFSQVPLMLVDVPLMFFLMLSSYIFLLALERGGALIALAALSICMTFYTKYSAFLMLTVLPVMLLVVMSDRALPVKGASRSGRGRTVFLRGAAVFLIAAVLTGIFFLLKYDVFMSQISLLREYQGPGLKRWGESFQSTFLFQVHPVITLAAVFSAWAALVRRDLGWLVPFWLLLLVLVFQIRRSRYVIMVFPMLTLLASIGLMQLKREDVRRFIVSCIVISSVVIGAFVFRPFLNNISQVNLREAGEFLDTLGVDGAEVFTVYAGGTEVRPAVAVPLLDLFTGKKIHYKDTDASGEGPEGVKTSSLRFTWEYPSPPYYEEGAVTEGKKYALVVITDQGEGAFPAALNDRIRRYGKSRVFDREEKEFAFSTLVRVYYD